MAGTENIKVVKPSGPKLHDKQEILTLVYEVAALARSARSRLEEIIELHEGRDEVSDAILLLDIVSREADSASEMIDLCLSTRSSQR